MLNGGTGDILLWIPLLICVSVMVAAMMLSSGGTAGADTGTETGPAGSSAPLVPMSR